MKVLSIKQPWASLIAHGIKDIENRTWKTNFRGRILIHSAKRPIYGKSLFDLLTKDQLQKINEKVGFDASCVWDHYGAIIGSVEIVDCVVNHPSIWAEKGVWNWVLANPIIFDKPIENVKGKLSFWDFTGINEVQIKCPECGSIELAIEDYTTAPFSTYLHTCKCGHVIMESEWLVNNPY